MTTITIYASGFVNARFLMGDILDTGGQDTYSGSGDGVLFNRDNGSIEIYRAGQLSYEVTGHSLSQSDFDYAAQGPGRAEEVLQDLSPFTLDATNVVGQVIFEDSGYADLAIAGDGGSIINIGRGTDNLGYVGGAGFDILDFSDIRFAVSLDLSLGLIDGNEIVSGSFEQVIGSDYNDTLIGDAGAQVFIGGGGEDSIVGDGGDDTLQFSELAETGVDINLYANTVIDPFGNDDHVEGISTIIGTEFDDYFIGGPESVTFHGMGGSDWVEGSLADDDLDGGEGEDDLVLWNASSAVEVYLNRGFVLSDDGFDTVRNFENVYAPDYDDTLVGNGQDNDFYGYYGNDLIKGRGGDDYLEGFDGRDTLAGGKGDDRMDGGAGADFLSGGIGFDEIFGGQGNDSMRGGADGDEIYGDRGYDIIKGDSGDDTVNGGIGKDTIYAGAGNDIVIGGTGNDLLVGGLTKGGGGDGYADTFVFSGNDGYDRIADFEDGLDQLDLSNLDFTDFSQVEALASERPAGVLIKFEPGQAIYIKGMSLAEFDATDVIL